MEENSFIFGVQLYAIILLAVAVIGYTLLFVWVMREGHRRDVGGIGLFMVSLLGSPLMGYAMVKSTRCDADRVKVEFETVDGTIQKSSLSFWLLQIVPFSSLKSIADINDVCRNCATVFVSNESQCASCGKKRVWYQLILRDSSIKQKQFIEFQKWQHADEGYTIIGVKRFAKVNQ